MRESAAALEGFFDDLGGARWVNDPRRERAAENKLLQLRAARESGFDVPPTLLTNDAARARAFYDAEGGRVVAKLLRPLSVSMGDAPFFVYTSDVGEEDLAALDSLRHCPVVFRRKIEKRRELRVAYVAGRLFTGALDASGSARGRTDWRLAEPAQCARRSSRPWPRDSKSSCGGSASRRAVSRRNFQHGDTGTRRRG